MLKRLAAAGVLALLSVGPSGAQIQVATSAGPLAVNVVARGLVHPWGLAHLPDGRMLVTERPGRLRIVTPAGSLSAPVANVPAVFASGQGGLLDVAVDPDFAANRFVYVSFAEPGEGGAGTAVARGRLVEDGTAARLEAVAVIFRQNRKSTGGRHFGSRLNFAPDGTLFITLGDRGEDMRSQDLGDHAAKVVRIRRDGSVPDDNPFRGRAGVLPDIYSYGHRNMQAATFDDRGRLWVVDHGARGGDEVNIVKPGANFGWPVISYGTHYSGAPIGEGAAKSGLEQPLHYWVPTSIAPSGAVFYSGKLIPQWRGSLLVGALRAMMVTRLVFENDRFVSEEPIRGIGARIRDVAEAPDGAILLLTDESDGRLLRLEPVR